MAADYYELLGIGEKASAAEIKKAFRKLGAKYHPDRNKEPDAEKRFKEINEAYQTLGDEKKRAEYDMMRSGAGFGFSGFGHGFPPGVNVSRVQDIFDAMFNNDARVRRGQPHKGRDIDHSEVITLPQAVYGCSRDVMYRAPTLCSDCGGTGSRGNFTPLRCVPCNGTGALGMQRGFLNFSSPCGNCKGAGFVPRDPCVSCNAQGTVERKNEVRVEIPPGADRGDHIRVHGHGQPGKNGGPPGDLIVVIGIEHHPTYARKGDDLHTKAAVTFTKCVIGGFIEVPMLDGEVKSVNVPAGANPSVAVIRVQGYGVRSHRTGRTGDLFIELELDMPGELSDRARELLEEFEEELDVVE